MKITTKFITAPGGRYDTLEIALLGREGREVSFWMRNFDQEIYHCAFELDTVKLFKADPREGVRLAQLLMDGISLEEGEGTKEARRTAETKAEFLREAAAQFPDGQEAVKIRVSRAYYGYDEEMEPEEFLPQDVEFAEEDWQTCEYLERCEEYVVDLKSQKTEFVIRSILHTEENRADGQT